MNNDLQILKKISDIESLVIKKFKTKNVNFKIQFDENELTISFTKDDYKSIAINPKWTRK